MCLKNKRKKEVQKKNKYGEEKNKNKILTRKKSEGKRMKGKELQ